MVRGTGNDAKVTVRIKNFYNDEVGEPLFLVNGVNYARDFQSVQNSINPEDVKSVEVYKTPAELMRYGVSGEHGVINIIMKYGDYPLASSWRFFYTLNLSIISSNSIFQYLQL